jgi:hypothetical protein
MSMLTTLIGLILIVIVLIWREIDSRIRDHAASVKAASEEMNKYLAQMAGEIGSIHGSILRLWACPRCGGYGVNYLEDFPARECETCKGTGMKAAGMKQPAAETVRRERTAE